MAKTKKPVTVEDLTKRLDSLQQERQEYLSNIAAVQGSYLDMSVVGSASYFKQNPTETKIEKQETPNYTNLYNDAYKQVQDIRMITGTDAKGSGEAFFVYNAADEARKKANDAVAAVETNNQLFEEQQKRINEFVKQQGESQKQAVYDQYLNTILNTTYKDLMDGYVSSDYSFFNPTAYKNAKYNNKRSAIVYTTDVNGRKIASIKQYYKLSDEEKTKQINIIKQVEGTRFTSDAAIQKKAASDYVAQQTAKSNSTAKAMAALNKRIATLTNKKKK